jgi:hypothetical protein
MYAVPSASNGLSEPMLVLHEEQTREAAIAQGRAVTRINAVTAILCGGLPAAVLGVLFPHELARWLAGFLIGLVWANGFEYAYHRFVLHLPGSLVARGHLLHHATTGTSTEAKDVNFGGSPLWVVLMFAANGAPVVAADLLFKLGVAPGVLLGFAAYFIAVEEIHWRFHLGGWLPPGLRSVKAYHLAHHDRPDVRFNVFLPLFDWLFGPRKV